MKIFHHFTFPILSKKIQVCPYDYGPILISLNLISKYPYLYQLYFLFVHN